MWKKRAAVAHDVDKREVEVAKMHLYRLPSRGTRPELLRSSYMES